MSKNIKAFIHDESGAAMVEYGLMIALIAVVCIAAVTTLGAAANNIFSTAGESMGNED